MKWKLAIAMILMPAAAWTFRAPADPPDNAVDPGLQESPVPPPTESPAPQHTSPAGAVARGPFVSVQVNVNAAGLNIVGDAANEPSIAIDPTNPDRVVIGWRQFDTILDSFRKAGWSFSHDGGQTWAARDVLESQEFSSDPVLAVDRLGRFYYYALQPNRGPGEWACYLYRSADGGVSWPQERYAYGGDKLWFTIDRTGGIGDGNIYSIWSPFATCCGAGNRFARSINAGFTFAEPVPFPGDSFAATLDYAADGTLYVVGTEGQFREFQVTRSTNARNPTVVPTFDMIRSVDLGGVLVVGSGPNPGGLLGQPWIAVDRSTGPHRGNVYVACSVADLNSGNHMDVKFVRSTDGGDTWSAPIIVNDDDRAEPWQWFGTMSVAPGGRIDIVWNDTRNSAISRVSELYYSNSRDGGLTWSGNIAVSPPFDSHLGWPQQNKIGDYYHMISDDTGANLAWSATFNGEQDVYFLRIELDCNENDINDFCDVHCAAPGELCGVPGCGQSDDCNGNDLPDECEPDCNGTGRPDLCDVLMGDSADCNENLVPDECEPDCNGTDSPDDCDIRDGISGDCNHNAIPDECDIAAEFSDDCQPNGRPDECDIVLMHSQDCDGNDVPDECDVDCNNNAVADVCDIRDGGSRDCYGPPANCASPHPFPGCNDPAIESCVCAVDAGCCSGNWDQFCVLIAGVLNCAGCTGGLAPDGIPDECQCGADAPYIVHRNRPAAASGTVTSPCDGYIDPRIESMDGAAIHYGPSFVTLVFNEPVRGADGAPIGPGDFMVTQTGTIAPPFITETESIDPTAYRLQLSRIVTPQEWTTLRAVVTDICGNPIMQSDGTGQPGGQPDRIDIGLLPGDVNQDGHVQPVDLINFRQYFAGGYHNACGDDVEYFDINHNGVVREPADLIRIRQILAGTPPATRTWLGRSMNHPRP
ncbi:MAG: hypothetical protein HOP29_15900 [Phycisphaerales bacterium]|nr:hypothetical protein [Phycisphaerales bacterium]